MVANPTKDTQERTPILISDLLLVTQGDVNTGCRSPATGAGVLVLFANSNCNKELLPFASPLAHPRFPAEEQCAEYHVFGRGR
jgi:hypothetical protein